jgi:hypothetical protein
MYFCLLQLLSRLNLFQKVARCHGGSEVSLKLTSNVQAVIKLDRIG